MNVIKSTKYADLKDEYAHLYDTVSFPNKDHVAEVRQLVDEATSPEFVEIYQQVQTKYGIPWWFVCCIHLMECNGVINGKYKPENRFKQHIHNGDPLARPTVNVPPDRPEKSWRSPPGTWLQSCLDAMVYDKLDLVTNWTLEYVLYRKEKYNGFRTRLEHNRPTPYLWSYSNHYTNGKFIADGVWSESTVSKQAGVVIILYEIERKFGFKIPRDTSTTTYNTPDYININVSETEVLLRLAFYDYYRCDDGVPNRSDVIAAIKKFQADRNLYADGVVGPKTKAALFKVDFINTDLSLETLIKQLQTLGLLVIKNPSRETLIQLVKTFQSSHGLEADGIIGSKTKTALMQG